MSKVRTDAGPRDRTDAGLTSEWLTGRRLWTGGSNGMSHSVVCIAPEIDFAVLVACNRGVDIAIWKTREAARALIRAFAPKRTS